MSELLELTHDKCEQLLRAGVLGRIVLNRPTRPKIVPVNYVVVADAILVRTSPGSSEPPVACPVGTTQTGHVAWR